MLNVVFRSPGSFRKNLSLFVAIFGGVAVDENSGRAFPLSDKSLEATIAVGIRLPD
jgi:hypothetical protein